MPYSWHDGSEGGVYGIGEGWSIDLLPAKYENITETLKVGDPISPPLKTIPPEYEWIKEDSEDLNGEAVMTLTFVTLPAEYETVTETVIVEAAKTKYYLSDTIYNSEGRVVTPRRVKRWLIPAVTEERERRVVKTPERTVERIIPLDKRKGYRRVVKTPARTVEVKLPSISRTITSKVEAQPWRFIIKNPDGQIAHSFDDFEALTAFTDSLK